MEVEILHPRQPKKIAPKKNFAEAEVSKLMSSLFVCLVCLLVCTTVSAFSPSAFGGVRSVSKRSSLQMIEIELNGATYAGMFFTMLVPSLAFVKFVGDAADGSREDLSDETRERFKRTMMEQPGQNLSLPTNEEESLKKAIAKAYMQDKDVDVAVLEEKLRKRAQWRKEMMAQQKAGMADLEDEDGW